MINIIFPLKYGVLYELGREGHRGFSHYNDLAFYGYYVNYIEQNPFPEKGFLFLENCREGKILLHYTSKFKVILFPDENENGIREVISIENTTEITNKYLKERLKQLNIPVLHQINLEENLKRQKR